TTEQGCRFWIDRGIDFLICQNDFALLAAAEKALCQAMRAAAKKTQKHMLKSKILGMSAFTFFLSLATVAALTTASVFVKPLWYKALPCFVTVAVLYLSANANKYSYLLGAANSVLYTVVYVVNGLYGGAVSGFLQGVMLQAAIFVKWSLSPGVKKKPVIKFLGKRNEAVVWAAMLGLWAAAYFVLRTLNGSNALLDALGFSLGIASFFMTIRAYAETWHIGMASYALQVVLWSVRIAADIRELPLLIISVYGLIKSVEGLLSWRKIRREQQSITASVHVPDTADERANE
ncbi:MAG: nicotinamide riboside transporter PnuC, partial [Clostridiales bacterium]|nr:nicotinamide riboside transporter PnuC [Clostridiales bacterium]